MEFYTPHAILGGGATKAGRWTITQDVDFLFKMVIFQPAYVSLPEASRRPTPKILHPLLSIVPSPCPLTRPMDATKTIDLPARLRVAIIAVTMAQEMGGGYLSSGQNPCYLVYIEDYTIQFYMDCNKQRYEDPYRPIRISCNVM